MKLPVFLFTPKAAIASTCRMLEAGPANAIISKLDESEKQRLRLSCRLRCDFHWSSCDQDCRQLSEFLGAKHTTARCGGRWHSALMIGGRLGWTSPCPRRLGRLDASSAVDEAAVFVTWGNENLAITLVENKRMSTAPTKYFTSFKTFATLESRPLRVSGIQLNFNWSAEFLSILCSDARRNIIVVHHSN